MARIIILMFMFFFVGSQLSCQGSFDGLCQTMGDDLRQNELKDSFTEIVTGKFIDTSDRMSQKITFSNGSTYYCYNENEFNDIKIGDSLIKKCGSLKHTLKRGNYTCVYSPLCRGEYIKDSL